VAGKYYLDDFILTTPELFAFNQIKNGDFEKKTYEWEFTTLSPAQATGTESNGEFAISYINGGINVWDVHLGQLNILAEKGKEYTISFDAFATAPRNISVFVGKSTDPWNVYSGNHILALTTSKKTYTFTFVMNETTDNLARFGFDAGANSSGVFIDNVFLSQGNKATAINEFSQTKPQSTALYQNFPNPFKKLTTIGYYIEKSSSVTIKIFDFSGKEIETLTEGFQGPGEHRILWNADGLPPGIYFSKLISGSNSETIKLLLTK